MHLFVGFELRFRLPSTREWTLAHLKVSDDIKKNNISLGYYEAGHMVSTGPPPTSITPIWRSSTSLIAKVKG
jgi:hypothetical protein